MDRSNVNGKKVKSKKLEKTYEISSGFEVSQSEMIKHNHYNNNSIKELDYKNEDKYTFINEYYSSSFRTIEETAEVNKPYFNTIESGLNEKKHVKTRSPSSQFFSLFLNQEKSNISLNKNNMMNTISHQESDTNMTKNDSPYNRTMNSQTANITTNNNLLSINLDSIDSRSNVNYNNPLNLKSNIKESKILKNNTNSSNKFKKKIREI